MAKKKPTGKAQASQGKGKKDTTGSFPTGGNAAGGKKKGGY